MFLQKIRKETVMNETTEKIINILKENTGSHMLDSGGAYGRHWERNQDRDFETEPACLVEISGNEDGTINYFNVNYNIYHFLKNYLEIDEHSKKMEKRFYKFSNSQEMKHENWWNCVEAFAKKQKLEINGPSYTYNFDNILSQNIQFWTFEYNDDKYIILQVHNGCDARGGLTKPAFFRIMGDSDYFYMAMTDLRATCYWHSQELKTPEDLFDLPAIWCKNSWYSDNSGYHWYRDDCDDDSGDFDDVVIYDPENDCLVCKDCGGKIEFYVNEDY